MKVVLALALLVAVTSALVMPHSASKTFEALRKLLEQRDKGGDKGKGKDGEGEIRPPKGTVMPLTGDDLLKMMHAVQDFTSNEQDRFAKLEQQADAVDGSEEDLEDFGEKLHKMMKAMEGESEGHEEIGNMWAGNMFKLMFAGVEDEGQCHKVLEFLLEAQKEAEANSKRNLGRRQMSPGELKFLQDVVEATKEEVGCIVDRFQEFKDMVHAISQVIENPPPPSDNGHAFEVEVMMGSLYFGYEHVFRQVKIFVIVMRGLMEAMDKESPPHTTPAGPLTGTTGPPPTTVGPPLTTSVGTTIPAPRSVSRNSLREVLRIAEELQRTMQQSNMAPAWRRAHA